MQAGNHEEKYAISDKRAREFARSFYTAVVEYCATHQEEYENWINVYEKKEIEK